MPGTKRKWNNGNKTLETEAKSHIKDKSVRFMPLDHLGQTNKGSRGGFSIFFFFEIPMQFLKEIRI